MSATAIRLPITEPRCQSCGVPLPRPKGTGRRRKFCSERCKTRARRRRQALPWPPMAPVGYPVDPEVVRRRTAAAIVAVMEGDRAAPAEDQLAQGLLEVDWLVYRFAVLERDLPPRLAGRAVELGKRIQAAKAQLFPELEEAGA